MTAPGSPTVPLPETGDGSRRRRRSAKRQRMRDGVLRVVSIAVVLGLLAGIVWAALSFRSDGSGDDPDDAVAPDDSSVDDLPTGPVLAVLTGDDGAVYGVTVFDAASASIVHIAPGTMVEVPSFGLASLHEAARDGEVELLKQSLENLLGLRFEAVATLGPGDLAALVQPLGSVTVEVGEAVEERSGDGRVSTVVRAGAQAFQADEVLTLLRAVGDRTSLDRLVRHQAFWDAYIDALGDEALPAAAGPLGGVLRALGGANVRHHVLPVEAVSGIEGDDELYRVLSGELADLISRLFPTARPVSERIRVRILNGAGTPGIAREVQPLLLDVGAEVTLSGNADRFDYATTQVVYYDDERLDDARAIRDALGVGEVVKSLTPLDVVDVTIVVGADFLSERGTTPTSGG